MYRTIDKSITPAWVETGENERQQEKVIATNYTKIIVSNESTGNFIFGEYLVSRLAEPKFVSTIFLLLVLQIIAQHIGAFGSVVVSILPRLGLQYLVYI